MTSPTNAHRELVRREHSLPGLQLLFDPARLAQILEAHCGVTLSSIEPVYLRYKRRTNCLVGYRVNGSMGSSYVYAKALRSAADDKLAKNVTRGAVSTWLGPGPLVLRDSAMTVWTPPNDGKLRTLRYLADDEGRATLLRRAPDDLKVAGSTALRTLSYKPERRFVTELRPVDSALPQAVLKLYTGGGFEQAFARASGVTSRDVLAIPTRMARDRRRHALFFEWLPGTLAADLVASEEPLGGRMALVGTALAELHEQPTHPSMPPSRAFDDTNVENAISEVEFLFPTLAGSLARLRACLSGIAAVVRDPVTPVHGDFHFRQVLLSASRVGIVDFDRAGAGSAVGDLAYCRAYLERDVLSGVLSRGRADDVMEELLTGYGRLRSRPSSSALDLYTAVVLALLLPEPFRLFQPDASRLTAQILDRSLALLTQAASRTAVS